MGIEEIKELYINNNPEADIRAELWSKNLFGVNVNGETFWSIGIDYISELIKLLGHTENYDKLSIEAIEQILNDEIEIKEMLNKVNPNDFNKLNEVLTLTDTVKDMLCKYIITKITEKKLKIWRENLRTNSENSLTEIEYLELTKNSFKQESERKYVANNVVFCNLKIEKVELLGELELEFETLTKVKQLYGDKDLKKMCIEGIVRDCSDWDDRITTEEEVSKFLTDVALLMDVYNGHADIWFNTTESDLFGGHNPKLCFVPDKNYTCVGME